MKIWWQRLVVGGAIALYIGLLGVALQPLSRADVWVSPDEAATAAFARAYAETGTFTLPEPLNSTVGGLLGARSMVARGGVLVPGGFLGLPWIAGGAVRLFGDGVLGWIAPLFAGLAVLAWGDLWRRLAGGAVGVGSALLLAVHPAWLLYASRPLMPNVPFVACLIVAAWALVRWPQRWWGGAMSGGFIMLALMIRTAEAVWVVPAVFVLLLMYRKALATEGVIAGFVAAFVCAGAFAGLQAATYGHALTSGYTYHEATAGQPVLSLPSQAAGDFSNVLRVLFPFGIHERSAVRHAWQYGWWLQWWWSILPTAGGALVLWRWKNQERSWQRVLLGMLVAIGGWLAVVYGSWTFYDNPDPRLITLGNSYARYFLPAFFLGSPLGAWALSECMKYRSMSYAGRAMMAAVTAASLAFVVRGPDGWQHVRSVLPTALEKRAAIMEQTSPEAVIILDRSDKYLVGYRQHLLVPLREEQTYTALGALAKQGPLYYFGLTLPPQDIEHLEQAVLAPQGLTIRSLQTISDETLYQVQ